MVERNSQMSHPDLPGVDVIRLGAAAAAMPLLGDLGALCQVRSSAQASGEWRQYACDKASTKYSGLDQITADNFSDLKVAWIWRSVEEELAKTHNLKTWAWEATPLMIDGVLYLTTSLSQAVALDAGTGKLLWVYDPETWKNGVPSNNGFVHRGVAYWADGKIRRIVYGTGDGYLICLHARTGKPVTSFGADGRIDLTQGLGRPGEAKALWCLLTAGHLPRRDRDGLEGKRRSSWWRDAAGGRARLRRPYRQAAVELSHDPAQRRVRLRHLEERLRGDNRLRKPLDDAERR